MLTQADIDREREESRRKAELDYTSGLKHAYRKGHCIGRIQSYEELLKRPETPTEQLDKLSLKELERLADELQLQVLQR